MGEMSFTEALEAEVRDLVSRDVPLSARLQAVADKVRELSADFADVIDRLIARLASSDFDQTTPRLGEPMPPFLLPDENGRLVSLDKLCAAGPVVIVFNRGHWCPYCQLHLDALARAEPEISAMGAQIVAISPETACWAARNRAGAQARFPVLSDLDGGYALEAGLLFWVGEEAREAMAAGGVDLSSYQANESWMLPIPATFVVDTKGIVRARHVDPDYRRHMDVDDLLKAVRACVEGQAA